MIKTTTPAVLLPVWLEVEYHSEARCVLCGSHLPESQWGRLYCSSECEMAHSDLVAEANANGGRNA